MGALSARTFGEAQIDFDVFATGEDECVGFGSAYLKSRSSDSFTAALKDFIAPLALNFNECGAIKVTKTKKHAASDPATQPHAGVTFTLSGNGITPVAKVTDANGVACFDGLVIDPDAYTVKETVPTGYAADGATEKNVTVTTSANCTGTPYTGQSVSFGNTPLTDVTVTIDSQIAGGTDTQVECDLDGETDDPPDDLDTADATGDGSLPATGLLPGTYTCTIVIDP